MAPSVVSPGIHEVLARPVRPSQPPIAPQGGKPAMTDAANRETFGVIDPRAPLRLAERTQGFKASPTNAMNKRAADLKATGRDTIPLSLGEPDFHTPENIKAAGVAAIQRNFTKYTP